MFSLDILKKLTCAFKLLPDPLTNLQRPLLVRQVRHFAGSPLGPDDFVSFDSRRAYRDVGRGVLGLQTVSEAKHADVSEDAMRMADLIAKQMAKVGGA